MVGTYTRTLTRQERLIKNLNDSFARTIRESFDGVGDTNYSYFGIASDGSILEDKPQNLYADGILIGDGFNLRKKVENVGYFDANIQYIYSDAIGKIYTFGDNFGGAYVKLASGEKIGLLDFFKHPEVEEYIEGVMSKFTKEKTDGMIQRL